MKEPVIIRVRDAGYQGYIATGGGKRASCSYSYEQALFNCAEKLFGPGSLFQFEQLEVSEADAKRSVIKRVEVFPYEESA
ncbi:hypothetical protein [Vreelandella maris]|uniref:Uncharacterized protein n=1 Tax=Vreelandella maris TaxID=2729617 RepID=A0A7Y6VA13_9GAMM|nr:hypothetical protein [Halomonas maris]NVF15974.1 hypothetical protein [Halomonas maris]